MKFAAVAALVCLIPLVASAAPGETVRPAVWTGQSHTFANGTKMTAKGTELTVSTASGQKIVMQRTDPDFSSSQPPPLNARPMNCASWLQTIQLSPLTNRAWRRAVVNYSNYCL